MNKSLAVLTLFFCALCANGHGGDITFKFKENKGQFDSRILYYNKLHIGDMFLEKDRFTFNLYEPAQIDEFYRRRHGEFSQEYKNGVDILEKWNMHAYSMVFVGANLNVVVSPEERLEGYTNYILGNEKSKWTSNVGSFRLVKYDNLYNGIDMEIYASFQNLKYDFIVAPGADVDQIQLDYQGVEDLRLDDGNLIVRLSNGEVKELKPVSYQMIDGQRKMVNTKFILDGTTVRFDFPSGYDKSVPLTVDPTWVFSTLTGSSADNWGYTATYDAFGNLYAGGIAFGVGYPTVIGSYQTAFGGGTFDISISKFSDDGTALLYSTYMGGTDNEIPHSMVVDSTGNLVVLATTGSSDFPITTGAYDQTFNGGTAVSVVGASLTYAAGSDMAVFRLNSTGTTLMHSTYVGGTGNDGLNLNLIYNYGDDIRGEVVVNDLDEVFVASSSLSTNFPTTAGSYSQTSFGSQDGVAFKLSNDLSSMMWGTYVGGSSSEGFYSMRIGTITGDAFLCGGTQSTDLATTAGVIGTAYNGGTHDGWVCHLSGTAGALLDMTYHGTAGYDQAFILELDDAEQVYTTGQTLGAWPVVNAAYSVANSKQFIHKMNSDFSTVDYSTVFGSGIGTQIDISITAFLVDNCGNVYVSGWGGQVNGFAPAGGTTTGMPVTGDAQQSTTDGSDFYFFVLERNASSQLYGSFLGSALAAEHVDGGTSRFDKSGNVYQAVCAACGGTSFPTTPGVWSSVNGSSNCNLGAIKFGFDFLGVEANATIPPNIIVCDPPINVNFTGGAVPNAFWDFGDGIGTSTALNPTYTYADTGSYVVMYVAIDSSTCNISDTVFLTVDINQSETFSASIDFDPPPPCGADSLLVDLLFTGSGADSIIWDMGDGTIIMDTVVNYYYTTPGTYTISLYAVDTVCNVFQTITSTVEFVGNIATEVMVPNVFTPNGDDKNDRITFSGVDPSAAYSWTIYNRWGKKVFESIDSQEAWNGKNKFNGKDLADGVYFYELLFKDECVTEDRVVSGYIHLIR